MCEARSRAFIDGPATVPIAAPAGLVAMGTEEGQFTLYPNDGSAPVEACAPGGMSDAKASSSLILIESCSAMGICRYGSAGIDPFEPYETFDGSSVLTYELDEEFAYPLRADSFESENNGIYRLDLATHQAEVLTAGHYEHLALSGSALWLSDDEGHIYRMPKDGSSAPALLLEQDSVLQLFVDDDYVYWHRFTSMNVGCVKRMQRPPELEPMQGERVLRAGRSCRRGRRP